MWDYWIGSIVVLHWETRPRGYVPHMLCHYPQCQGRPCTCLPMYVPCEHLAADKKAHAIRAAIGLARRIGVTVERVG